MLPNDPGQRATVLVAFATIGAIPSPTSAGNVSSVPPPAIAFIEPATAEVRTTIANRRDCSGMAQYRSPNKPHRFRAQPN